MDLDTAIRKRRSVRQFKKEPLAAATIEELLQLARWAPSWANTQGWRIFAVTGSKLEQLRAAYQEKSEQKVERSFELPPTKDWPPQLRARTEQLKAARKAVASEGAPTSSEFFGAPCLLLFAVEEQLQPAYACFDLGLLVQTVCLAATGRGLGTCIMAMAVAYPDVLHELLPQAQGLRFVVGLALGVPDWQAPINQFERQRAALAELVSWA